MWWRLQPRAPKLQPRAPTLQLRASQVRGARPEPLRKLVQEQLDAQALRREQEDAEQEEERLLRLEYEQALRASPISAEDLGLEESSEHQRRAYYGSPNNQDLGV